MVGRSGHGGRGRRTAAARVGAAVLLGLLTLLLTTGTASAQDAPGPQPYGGQLGRMDPGDEVSSEQVLEVGMLALGTVNGLAFAVAMVASRLRGPSAAQTRRALINRTGAGTVSESRRARRARVRPGAAAPVTAAPAVGPGGPRGLAPQEPPAGAVPEQGRAAAAEGLVPAARATSHGPAPVAGDRAPAPLSPPTGVRSPVRR